ncbi:MAG: energy transducer TonB [Candidatus Solibacter sp.]
MSEQERAEKQTRRGPLSFAVSGCLHGGVLAWVMFSGAVPPRAQSIYDQEIRPHEKKIVWYNLREKLPEISSPRTQADARPARARVKSAQTMISGLKDDAKPGPLIWSPEPAVAAPREIPLPNVVAVAPPKVVRPFTTPPELVKPPTPAPELPDAPRAATAEVKQVDLPVVRPSGASRAFTPPARERLQRQAALTLPEGPTPTMRIAEAALPFPAAGPRLEPKKFTPPAARQAKGGRTEIPAAPEVAAARPTGSELARVPRGYIPRKGPSAPVSAPVIQAEPPEAPAGPDGRAETALAIVGLNPANVTEVPALPPSRASGFSAGPELRSDGGTGSHGPALVNVPGLVVKGGAKDAEPTLIATFSPTSRENLLAAVRKAGAVPAALMPAPRAPEPHGTRVSDVPDPRLAGRVVYSIAIQMPNVTSYSGSWLVWFAEREPVPGAAPPVIRAPEVIHKVDPKYVASAVADRVEGNIRLFGVIQKDGHVGKIAMIRQLDGRLDQTAQEALAKWEFTPALRNGVPVDVDAVFEIPFRLAPRVNR